MLVLACGHKCRRSNAMCIVHTTSSQRLSSSIYFEECFCISRILKSVFISIVCCLQLLTIISNFALAKTVRNKNRDDSERPRNAANCTTVSTQTENGDWTEKEEANVDTRIVLGTRTPSEKSHDQYWFLS